MLNIPFETLTRMNASGGARHAREKHEDGKIG